MVVLTGGAGFIGSRLLGALNKSGREDVLIVDNLRSGGKWKNLVGHTYIDIVSKEDFREQMLVDDVDDVDAVIHMGACSSTTELDADYLYDNNYRYSVDVAEFAMNRGARFIYASSAATYGGGERGYKDSEVDLLPMNMYGYSKHLFDLWVRKNGLEDQCVGLKFFNVFGPNEYHKGAQSSMVFKAYHQIQKTGRVKLFKSNTPDYEDGGQLRDFIYVKDVEQVVITLLEQANVQGIVNLGTGKARSWNDLMAAVFAAMEKEVSIDYVDMPVEIAQQYQNYTKADMTRFSELLPSVTFSSLEDSVADYVTNHLRKQ